MAAIEFKWRPSRRDLQLFFGLWLPLFFGAIGGYIAWRNEQVTAGASGLWAIAGISLLAGWLRPESLRWVYVLWLCLAFPIGWLISHAVLAFIYYVIMTPFGVIARAFGYDPMQRKYDPRATSYWINREPQTDSKRYFRPI